MLNDHPATARWQLALLHMNERAAAAKQEARAS